MEEHGIGLSMLPYKDDVALTEHALKLQPTSLRPQNQISLHFSVVATLAFVKSLTPVAAVFNSQCVSFQKLSTPAIGFGSWNKFSHQPLDKN